MKLTMKKLALTTLCITAFTSGHINASQEMHSRVHQILITCFLETHEEGHLSQFIEAICDIIKKHRVYFSEQYPNIDINKLLADLESIKHESNVMKIATALKPYWDLLPAEVKSLSMVKLAVNVRKRVRGKKVRSAILAEAAQAA